MLEGLFTAMVTPFKDDLSIDYDSFIKLMKYQDRNASSGVVVLGSTGESATLNHDEKIKLINLSVQNKGNLTLIIGVADISTNNAIKWVKELNDINGIDYLLVLTPPYVKAPQRGLYKHFAEIAKVSKKPIILYNVPGRTGSDLSDDTVLKLAADFDNIIGLKDATGNIARCNYLVKNKNKNFSLLSGDDATTLSFVLSGGQGAISVTGNIAPKKMSEMIKNAFLGNKEQSLKINNELSELHENLFVESNPIPVKWGLYNIEIIKTPNLRLPLTILDDKYQNNLTKLSKDAIL